MWRLRAAAVLLLTGLLAGCSSGGVAADLEGRAFVSTDVRGYELMDGTQVTITFRDDDLRASASCNTMSGAVSVEDSKLRLVDGLMITEMGCHPPGPHEQENWLGGVLASEPRIELDGATLVLEGDGVLLTLEERSAPSPG